MSTAGERGRQVSRALARALSDAPAMETFYRRISEILVEHLDTPGVVFVTKRDATLEIAFSTLPEDDAERVLTSNALAMLLVPGWSPTKAADGGLLVPLPAADEIAGVLYIGSGEVEIGEADIFAIETAAIHMGTHIARSRAEVEMHNLQELALHDSLTGLSNRRRFDECLEVEWGRACRGRYNLGLIIIDVDFFGLYNTRYGHPAGDNCLRLIAGALSSAVGRDTDLLARYGGEEFVAILPATDLNGAIVVGERMREAVEALGIAHDMTGLGKTAISVGAAALVPDAGADPQNLVEAADSMLLAAKARGRNRLVCDGYESEAAANERRYAARHNLPSDISRFIGREREVLELAELLKRDRLVTIAGPGGVGKTRLACEAARRRAERYADGVCFVDFSSVRHAEGILSALAHALDVRGEAGEAIDQTLLDRLAAREQLLLFDNCEHLLEDLANLIEQILTSSSGVRILATSRQSLSVTGETIYAVQPLNAADARTLFNARLQASTASGVLSAADAEAVERICDRLDRLPLAIELVAPRAAGLGIEGMLDLLDDGSFMLSTSLHSKRERQQTVSNLLDWSYRLLTSGEREIFERLSVLVGEWDEPTALAICADQNTAPAGVSNALKHLVEKSLLLRDERTGLYRMLELTAQFGRERLRESGEYDSLRARHTAEFNVRSRSIGLSAQTGRFSLARVEMDRNWANIAAALHAALIDGGDVNTGAEIAGNLSLFWDMTGRAQEATYWLNLALAYEHELTQPVLGNLLLGSATLATTRTDHEALRRYSSRAIALFERLEDRKNLGIAQRLLANAELFVGDHEKALPLIEKSMENAVASGDTRLRALCWLSFGVIAHDRAEYDEAARLYGNAIEIFRGMDMPSTLGHSLMNLSAARSEQGHFDVAVPLMEEAIRFFEIAQHKLAAYALSQLAAYQIQRSDIQGARRSLERALSVYAEFSAGRWACYCLAQFAQLAHMSGGSGVSANLAGFVEAYRRENGFFEPETVQTEFANLCKVLGEALGPEAYRAAFADGAVWSLSTALAAARRIAALADAA